MKIRKNKIYFAINSFVILFVLYSVFIFRNTDYTLENRDIEVLGETVTRDFVYLQTTSSLHSDSSITISAHYKPVHPIDYLIITETPIPTATPLPTATPTITPTKRPMSIPASDELENWFTKYSSLYNIDREQLKRIGYCESKFNSQAVNGPYAGMFQFSQGAWTRTRRQMGEDASPDLRFSAEESVKTAAFKIASGGIRAWPNCSK